MEPIVHGILEYSLKPYAAMNNMDVKDLIQKLFDHYQMCCVNNTIFENYLKNSEGNISVANKDNKSIDLLSNNEKSDKKRGRGRPKGSKNKIKYISHQ